MIYRFLHPEFWLRCGSRTPSLHPISARTTSPELTRVCTSPLAHAQPTWTCTIDLHLHIRDRTCTSDLYLYTQLAHAHAYPHLHSRSCICTRTCTWAIALAVAFAPACLHCYMRAPPHLRPHLHIHLHTRRQKRSSAHAQARGTCKDAPNTREAGVKRLKHDARLPDGRITLADIGIKGSQKTMKPFSSSP